ncbi:MAG TPA: alpha/beta fold hydrolase [Trebonia sp.]|nr:alpha/beta fold hydrolase [Trebonia sp.]
MDDYLDYSGRDDALGGGARRIPVRTPAGTHQVWVKRIGNNPALRVLLLHGAPGVTHEYLEACDSFLPAAGVEYYYYDQLGSGFSDQPAEPSLWDLDRFVDEVEQVRGALGLDRENFVLYGHSWGGILAIEYALRHQRHLRGLVISNMMSRRTTLMPSRCSCRRWTRGRWPRSRRWRQRATRTIRGTCSCCTSSTTSATCCACRQISGPIRCSEVSPTSTRRSTCRCRAQASSASLRTRSDYARVQSFAAAGMMRSANTSSGVISAS